LLIGAPTSGLSPLAVLVDVNRSLLMEGVALSFMFLAPIKLPAVFGGPGTSTVEMPICSRKWPFRPAP